MTEPTVNRISMGPAAGPPHQSVPELLARLDAAHAASPGLILASDADGTLWDGDIGDDIFAALLEARGFREAARSALAAEAAEFHVAAEGDACAIAAALDDAFKDGRYPPERNYAMVAWAFAGWHVDELRGFCARALDAVDHDARVRPELRAVLEWARGRDVAVYVVSASPLAMVQAAVSRLGIGADHVVAMTPAVGADGVLLPRLAGPVVYGDGKLHALERARPGASILAAFGDSGYDAPMLRAARIPVAVAPAKSLIALLPTIPGVTILAG